MSNSIVWNEYSTLDKFEIHTDPLSRNPELPVLVTLGGFSGPSFDKTAAVIHSNISRVSDMFSAVYMIKYPGDIKDRQNAICARRDAALARGVPDAKAYAEEFLLNKELAHGVNNLKFMKACSRVALLGKCAGAGVAIELVPMNTRYTALYLSVPSSRFMIDSLICSPSIIERVKFRFAWNRWDTQRFKWIPESVEFTSMYERDRYNTGLIGVPCNCLERVFDESAHEVPATFFDPEFLD